MLKNKVFTLGLLTILLSHFLIKETISFFIDSVEGEVISLKTSQWVPADSQAFFIKDELLYSIEEKIDSKNTTSLEQNFTTENNKYLSFQYKINSDEDALGFDEPNFLVKVNQKTVFQDQSENNIWKRGFINLANYKDSGPTYKIDFLSNNTFDEIKLPSLEIKEVSTSKFLAKKNDLLSFSVSKPNSKIYLKYSVEENGVVTEKEQSLIEPYQFSITEHFYNDQIEYYSVDSFNNVEDSKFIYVYTDFDSSNKIEDAEFFVEGDSELSINFTVPDDHSFEVLSLYDIRFSSDSNLLIDSWAESDKLNSVLPSKQGSTENISFKNLALGKTFVAIKSIDQAGNYSEISNIGEVIIE